MTMEIRFLFLLVAVLITTSTTIPAYAFIENLQVDKKYYVNDDEIRFSGLVGKGTTELVTIVINDPNNEFTLLKQAFPKADKTFELVVNTNTKFLSEGTYNATAFVVNMTKGASIIFDYYFNENSVPSELIFDNNKISDNTQTTNQSKENQINEETVAVRQAKENPETINYLVGQVMKKTKGNADPTVTLNILKEKLK